MPYKLEISAQFYMGVVAPLMLLFFSLTVAVVMSWCMKNNTTRRLKIVMGVCIVLVVVLAGISTYKEYG